MQRLRSATCVLWVMTAASFAVAQQQTTPAQPIPPAGEVPAQPVTPGAPPSPVTPGTMPETQPSGAAQSQGLQNQVKPQEDAGKAQAKPDRAQRRALKQQRKAARAQAKAQQSTPKQ